MLKYISMEFALGWLVSHVWPLVVASPIILFLLGAALLVGLIAGAMLRRRRAIVAGVIPGVAAMLVVVSSGTSSEGFMMFGVRVPFILVGVLIALAGANTAALAWAWRHRPVADGSAPIRGDGPGTAT